MSNPFVQAFFIGRALAEAIGEQVETAATSAMSELGKFDAEQRERLRQFTSEVLERAKQQEELAMQERGTTGAPSSSATTSSSVDLQANIDELRAEIAHLRAEMLQYRNRTL